MTSDTISLIVATTQNTTGLQASLSLSFKIAYDTSSYRMKSSGFYHACHFTWWRHQMETFSALLVTCAGNSSAPVNSPHKGQWHGTLMFSLICVWINGWVNNREAGDLRRYRAHCDDIVMRNPQISYSMFWDMWPVLVIIFLIDNVQMCIILLQQLRCHTKG